MDLERNIKKIEELISDDRIGLAIQALRDLLKNDEGDYFRSDSDSLISLESRYNRNERGYNLDGRIELEEYQLELNKIKKGLFSVRNNIRENSDQLGIRKTNVATNEAQAFFRPTDTITEKASKIVLLFLMAAAAILLIYFIAFHKDEDTQITGILASGGVVVVSLFKQTLDKYIRLRFS